MARKLQVEQLLRPVVETNAAIGWGIANLWVVAVAALFNVSAIAAFALWLITGSMAFVRGRTVYRMYSAQLALLGKPVELITPTELRAAAPKLGDQLWMGWGWRWQPSHTARAFEISKHDIHDVYPPAWALRLLGETRRPADERGLQWIHGLEQEEKDVIFPLDAMKGHCAVIATTGAIKTRLISLIIPQLVQRGDVVIVIDPKPDKELEAILKDACRATGDKNRFLKLHPSNASESIRLDLLKNWDSVSEVASRVSLVLGTEDSNFKQFCWMAVHRITNGLKYIGRRANIATLRTSMESRSSVERIAYEALTKFINEEAPHLKQRVAEELNKLLSKRPQSKGAFETGIPELTAMVAVFNADVPETEEESRRKGGAVKPEEVRGLVTVLEYSKEWFGKMISTITPMLTKLTTDDLHALLSPDYEDPLDSRPIMDMKRIIQGGHSLYIGTNALADPDVGRTLAAMAIADSASVAAEIYNHGLEGMEGRRRRVHLVVDEWGDAMCPPLVQQANKGRGADIFIWALGQTFADLVVAFNGDIASAKRFMGNMNNLIVGAIHDTDTIQMVTERFGDTAITVSAESKATGSKTEDTGLEFSANTSMNIDPNSERELIPPGLFRELPDLQYFAIINRSWKFKGRIPVVKQETK